MKNIKFFEKDESNENLDKIFNYKKLNVKTNSFGYLSSPIAYKKDEKEESGTSRLGNTVINDIF